VNPQFYAAFADGFQSASECACQFRVGPGAKEAVFSHHPRFKISGGFGANAQFAAAVSDGKYRAPQEQRDLTIGTSAQDPVVFRPPEFAFRIEGRDALVEPSCGNGVVTALQPAGQLLVRHGAQQGIFFGRPGGTQSRRLCSTHCYPAGGRHILPIRDGAG